MAFTEHRNLLSAVRTFQITHVFNQSQNRNIHLLRHVDRFCHDHRNQLLRGSHNDNTCQRQGLKYSQRHIAGSRRHIDKHIINVLPECLAPELLNHAAHNRSTPNYRIRLMLQNQVRRKNLYPRRSRARQHQLIRCHTYHAVNAKCLRDRRSCNIGIENANAVVSRTHLTCHQGCHQGFSDAALAADYTNYFFN